MSCDDTFTWSQGLGIGLAALGIFGGMGLFFWLMGKGMD